MFPEQTKLTSLCKQNDSDSDPFDCDTLKTLTQMSQVPHSLGAACEKYILLDQRVKKYKLKASQMHLNSTLTMTDWCCCPHGGLLLFTNAASAPSRQSCSVYAKLQHYFLRKDDQSGLSTMNDSLMEALLQFRLS